MSFASEVKKELTELEVHPQHAKAELAAFIQLNGSLRPIDNQNFLTIETENAAIARRIYSLVKAHLHIQPEISVIKKMTLKKNNIYTIKFRQGSEKIMEKLGIAQAMLENNFIPDEFKEDEQKSRSYLRGAFLARGSVNSPETSRYHLEIYSPTSRHSSDLADIMNHFDLHPRVHDRKARGMMVYMKESEKIADFLAIIGSRVALFKFEDVRIVRDMRNSVNRLVNCENANLNKTVNAATRQINDIELIIRTEGMESLSPSLREIAKLRLDHPNASLKELGELVESGKISKSAVNHRMRKIAQKAELIQQL